MKPLGFSRPSPFMILVLTATIVNLSAFLLSSRIPAGALETNPYVRPGSLISLGFSEGLVLVGSFFLRIMPAGREERIIIQAAVVALLSGDSINDLILVTTGNQFLAIVSSYTVTAVLPAFVAVWWVQSQIARYRLSRFPLWTLSDYFRFLEPHKKWRGDESRKDGERTL